MGHWVVDAARSASVDVEVIFHPDVVTGQEAAITLKVGEKTFERASVEGAIRFDGIPMEKGEVRLEARRRDGGKEVGAYQLIVSFKEG